MSRRVRIVVASTLGGLVLLVVVLEVALPRIAERVVRGRLQDAGEVAAVDVRARPAVRLLWGSFDAVDVRMRTLDVERLPRGGDGLGGLPADARATLAADRVRASGFEARDARTTVQDGALRARATVAPAGLLGGLGGGAPRINAGAEAVDVELDGGLLGTVGGRVRAAGGRIVLEPRGGAGLGSLLGSAVGPRTLVEQPDVAFTRFGGRALAGGEIAVEVDGRLR